MTFSQLLADRFKTREQRKGSVVVISVGYETAGR